MEDCFDLLNVVHYECKLPPTAAQRRTPQGDAAREIFVHEGYERFSMRKPAEKIAYSPGSVYLHFNSKEELFECLAEESFARLLKTLTGLGNGRKWQDPVEELKKGMRAYRSNKAST